MSEDEMAARTVGDRDEADGRSAFPRKIPRPCPVCGLAVPAGEVRCPRCRALLVTSCAGGCASCGSRSCVRGDDADSGR
jgi:hypothetical protein